MNPETPQPNLQQIRQDNLVKVLAALVVAMVVMIIVLVVLLITINNKVSTTQNTTNPTADNPTNNNNTENEDAHEEEVVNVPPPDPTKLPLGDNKYSTSPKKGYIYSCQTSFNGGGAFQAGPWINQTTKTWDLTKKVQVDGNVDWPNAKWTISNDGTTRKLVGNGLPDHETGTYPVKTTDDAYQYDRNPNSIKEQTILIELPTNPTLLSTPQCAGGEVGIMLSGVPLFNGFDAGGRDAVAMEIQDKCAGHPQSSGQYHYHSDSACIDDNSAANEHSELKGYALDGFGLYGSKGQNGAEMSTEALDECHGHTHKIMWDGKEVEMYHYHLTKDFPYSVGCFRGKAVRSTGAAQQEQNQQPGGTMPPQGTMPPMMGPLPPKPPQY